MSKKWNALTYVDLFAGPGRCFIKSTNEEREGSPLIALSYPFSDYVFVEASPEDLEALKKRCAGSPKFSSMKFILGDCNEKVNEIQVNGLGLAFIDPVGIDVYFETIKKLAANQSVDLLINVQFGMDIKRNFETYVKKGEGSPLDHFLGGNVDWKKLGSPRQAIELYKKRIASLGYSTVEFKDIVVRNVQKNVPMYFLLFASKHPRGVDFWKKITAKDESGQFEFEW